MFAATVEKQRAGRAACACPPWCESFHTDPDVEDHIRLIDAVHREPHLESVAVELELAEDDRHPVIVLSLFTKTRKPKAMCAGLTIDQAHHAYIALGEALRLANDSTSTSG